MTKTKQQFEAIIKQAKQGIKLLESTDCPFKLNDWMHARDREGMDWRVVRFKEYIADDMYPYKDVNGGAWTETQIPEDETGLEIINNGVFPEWIRGRDVSVYFKGIKISRNIIPEDWDWEQNSTPAILTFVVHK